ncbi:FAD:protein FMN transferase [Arenibacter nanhaiticus]|nr:FAD:protein FMN transferase [Arenibacter nanhaiticus]
MRDLLKYPKRLLGVGALLVVMVQGCGEKNQLVKNVHSGEALGTSYNLIIISDKELKLEQQIDSIFEVVNHSMSTYIPTSDISKINKGDSTLVVDHMFQEVFNLSKAIYEKTDGYFDPTVGSLVNAWGFGPGEQIELDSIKVDSLLDFVGFNKVLLTAENKIKKKNPNIYFDFNAIAKGYSIDRLAVMLDGKGITNYLLEVGGELVAKGENTIKKKQWVVAVDDPQMGENRTSKRLVNLKDRAMASSGNYRKYRVDKNTGEKYVHTIDPKSGFTKNSNILATTVVAENCATADAFATGFMAMDLEQSKAILEGHKNLEGYIIYIGENGNTQEYMTEGFKKMILE